LSHASLAHGLDSARRLDALEQAFDALDLANEQLFSSIGLLDRYAAASNSRGLGASWGPRQPE
ncbi:unnamed protein product, partial [Effrenium voratum]